MAKSYQDRKDQFAENVAKLMEAGFSRAEANKARGYSAAKIEATINAGKLPSPALKQQAARQGKTKEYSQAKREGRLPAKSPGKQPPAKTKDKPKYKGSRGDKYETVPTHLGMVFYNRYSYVIEYRTKNADGEVEIKYVTVTSDEKMSTKEAKAWAKENIFNNPENQEKYKSDKVDLRTMRIIGRWYNPNAGGKVA